MELLLSLGNRRRDTGTHIRMGPGPIDLCMARVPRHYGFFPKFYLVLRQFNGQPLAIRLQSATEAELELNGNYLEVWSHVRPTLASVVCLQKLVLANSSPPAPNEFDIHPPVTFLELINSSSAPVIIVEELYSMAFWLPPAESVTFECRIRSFSCGFYFTEPYMGHPTFMISDCYSLELSKPSTKKVEAWGRPEGLEEWALHKCAW